MASAKQLLAELHGDGGRPGRRLAMEAYVQMAARGEELGSGRAEDEEEEADMEAADYDAIVRITLTRTQLEAWEDKPFFGDVVPGCFVRASYGPRHTRRCSAPPQPAGCAAPPPPPPRLRRWWCPSCAVSVGSMCWAR